MPVEFLSDERASAYGRYQGEPSRAELDERWRHLPILASVTLHDDVAELVPTDGSTSGR